MGCPVVHWEIAGNDGTATQGFYRQLFDWPVQVHEEMGGYGMVPGPENGPGIGGGIMKSMGPQPYVTIYVQVDDLQAYLDKAVSLGGKAVVPPTPIPHVGSFAMFTDPDGNMVGLFKG